AEANDRRIGREQLVQDGDVEVAQRGLVAVRAPADLLLVGHQRRRTIGSAALTTLRTGSPVTAQRMLSASSEVIRPNDSCVEPAVCDVSRIRSLPRSGLSAGSGSTSKTRSSAPARCAWSSDGKSACA